MSQRPSLNERIQQRLAELQEEAAFVPAAGFDEGYIAGIWRGVDLIAHELREED